MYAFPTRLRPPAARARKDDPMMAVDPAAAVTDPEVDSALAGVVENVAAVEPVKKRWRAVVTRNVVETAIVEFDAYEDEDQYTLAEALLPSIPPEAWSETPEAGWGYIDRIEEVSAAAVDPAATPAETLARRARRPAVRRGLAISKKSIETVLDGLASIAAYGLLGYGAGTIIGTAIVKLEEAAAGMIEWTQETWASIMDDLNDVRELSDAEAAAESDAAIRQQLETQIAALDQIIADLNATPPDPDYYGASATLARRSRFGRKGTFDITAADGTYYGSFEAPTADEAITAYVASLGYATTDEAALAAGFATADEFIASLVVTEAPAADPAADPAAAPEVMSFKTAGDVTAAVEQIGADAEATLAALDMADATAVATAIDYLISLRDQLDVALATGLTGEPDAALAQEAMDAANELWTWLDEQIDVLQGDIAADPALAA